MRIILKIAGAELRSLFFSPIAWSVFVIFYLVTGIPLIYLLKMGVVMQENIKSVSSEWKDWGMSLTGIAFSNVFETVTRYLYIFVPLLTMGIINKEISGGTIKLLYSSPVRARHIAFGKFIGLMATVAGFILIVGLFSLAGFIAIKAAEPLIFFSALFGFFLLTGAYAAIGLFISALTSYQIVAGVATFVVFFILHMMSNLWQQYDLVRDLTYFLSMAGRITNLTKGLITTKDVIYFLLIMALFIGFVLVKLRSAKEPGNWRTSFYRYLAVFAIVLTIGYFSSRPGYIGYLDVTHNQVNTIRPITQGVLAELGDEPLKVTLYVNLFDNLFTHGLPKNRNKYIWDFWDPYVRFHPDIQFNYVYYYDIMDSDSILFKDRYPKKSFFEVAEDLANTNGMSIGRFKSPKEIRSMIDLQDEDKRLVMQLEYKGKKTFLRTYPDPNWPWPEEPHVSAAVRRLVKDTMPLILFTSGHYERNPYKFGEREYSSSMLRKVSTKAMLNLGADVDTISLTTQTIPDHTSILVVADPKSALLPAETDKIVQYLNKGGNAVFYGEPGKQEMLNPILQSIGVQLDKGTIVKPNDQEMPHILEPPVTVAGGRLAKEMFLYLFQLDTTLALKVKQPGAAAISYSDTSGFTIQPVIDMWGNEQSWIENGVLVVDSAAPVFAAAEGDVRKSHYATGIKMSRRINNREQRIVVLGDADFMTDLRGIGGVIGNAAYSWALYNEYPKYANRPLPKDTLFVIGPKTGQTIFILYLFVIPGLTLIAGTIILIRRNRR